MSTGNGIDGLTDQARLAGEWRRANPEAITVLVLTRNKGDAAAIAHGVAYRLHPGRLFGPILFMEQDADGNWLVDLQDDGVDRGPRRIG